MSKKHHFKRTAKTRNYRPSILIICEGETEYYYFSSFRSHATIEIGEVGNPITFVEKAIEHRKRIQKSKDLKYDQTWLVFDRDDFDEDDFRKAIQKAEKEGFLVAYSNQAFDYWYLLHVHDHNGNPMARTLYKGIIDRNLSFEYDKDRRTLARMYEELIPYQNDAISHADQILARKLGAQSHTESVTKVHKLVKELNKYIQ